jgi:hypothetical protein
MFNNLNPKSASVMLPKRNIAEYGEDLNDFDLNDDLDNNSNSMDFLGDNQISPINKYNELLKDLTDFDLIIKDTIRSWLGLVWNEQKKEYLPSPELEPIINYKGAAWCIGFLKTYARKTNIITTIRKEDYEFLHLDIISMAWLALGTRDDFGIKSNSDLFRIAVELEHSAILVLMGAGEGKYNNLLSTATSRHENVNYSPYMPGGNMQQMPIKKKGFFKSMAEAITGART